MSNNWYFSEGKALAELAFNNRSLRDALLATTESVAVGIHVENWSTYRLWQPEYEMEKGRTYSEEAAKLAGTLPGTVSSCKKSNLLRYGLKRQSLKDIKNILIII